jgi:hypothetical protein
MGDIPQFQIDLSLLFPPESYLSGFFLDEERLEDIKNTNLGEIS